MSQHEQSNAQTIIKAVTSFVVGVSTTAVTQAIIRNNVATPENTIQKVEVGVASVAIGAVVTDKTRRWSDNSIDKLFTAFREVRTQTDAAKAEKTQS